MTQAERLEYVRLMLARFRDCLHQGSIGPSHEAFADRLLLFPREFNQAMRELDRCLDLMRVDEPGLRWHVLAFYADVHYRQVPRFRIVVGRSGKRNRLPAGYQLQPKRHRDVDERLAGDGVTWLAERFQWDRVHLKAILEATGQIAA